MKRARARLFGLTLATLAVGTALAPAPAVAQSELAAAEAQEFLGAWLVKIPTDQGEMLVELGIEDEDGIVAASITMIGMGTQPVSDISRADDALQFKLEADAQGQLIPIQVRLTPNGEELAVLLDINMGEFSVEGVATRMAS